MKSSASVEDTARATAFLENVRAGLGARKYLDFLRDMDGYHRSRRVNPHDATVTLITRMKGVIGGKANLYAEFVGYLPARYRRLAMKISIPSTQ